MMPLVQDKGKMRISHTEQVRATISKNSAKNYKQKWHRSPYIIVTAGCFSNEHRRWIPGKWKILTALYLISTLM